MTMGRLAMKFLALALAESIVRPHRIASQWHTGKLILRYVVAKVPLNQQLCKEMFHVVATAPLNHQLRWEVLSGTNKYEAS
jgi:hypothetical protein